MDQITYLSGELHHQALTMKKYPKQLLFGSGAVLILLFLIWSRQVAATIVLLIILDSFTLRWLPARLQEHLPKTAYELLGYAYAVLLPVFVAIFIRTFFFDYYYVPSSSMERSLFPEDYVVVNKFSYGVKVPARLQGLPILRAFFKNKDTGSQRYKKLPAFRALKRNDVIVFDTPLGSDPFLVKRIVGLPGDTIEIIAGQVHINHRPLTDLPEITYEFVDTIQNGRQKALGFSNAEYELLSHAEKERYRKVIKVRPGFEDLIFPGGKQQEWTLDQYGPLIVPQQGLTLTAGEILLPAYQETIRKYEAPADTAPVAGPFIFRQNYYFVLGDNRHRSVDSRSFGFVPGDYIQGKMIGIFSRERLRTWLSAKGKAR